MANHFHSSNTQFYWAVKALMDGRTLSHKTEIREVNGWRLAAIVCELRQKYHWPILAEYRGPENIAHYRLNPSCNPAGLKFPRSARALKPESGGQI
jgi:hypothetical protein